MYRSACQHGDCSFGWTVPSERDAWKKTRDHVEDEGHLVRITGVYDSPRNGGYYYPDGDGGMAHTTPREIGGGDFAHVNPHAIDEWVRDKIESLGGEPEEVLD